MNVRECIIIGTGSYLPARVINNESLSACVGISPEHIVKMTGIYERRQADAEEASSDLATRAALSALEASAVRSGDIDLIITATTSPDMLMPSTACFVQKNIDAGKAAAFDINASCSGFLYAMNIASVFINNGKAETALVVAAEVKSRFVNQADKETAIIFGDGAGAVVLKGVNAVDAPFRRGILKTSLFTDGRNWKWIHLPAGGSRTPTTSLTLELGLHSMKMDGGRVFKAAIRTLTSAIEDACKGSNICLRDIDVFVFHQANLRIINQVIQRLGIDKEKVPLTLPDYGNTSSASIPITLDSAVSKGMIKKGSIVALTSFGGGLTWGVSIIRW